MCGCSILSCCPRNPHGHERVLKEEEEKAYLFSRQQQEMIKQHVLLNSAKFHCFDKAIINLNLLGNAFTGYCGSNDRKSYHLTL